MDFILATDPEVEEPSYAEGTCLQAPPSSNPKRPHGRAHMGDEPSFAEGTYPQARPMASPYNDPYEHRTAAPSSRAGVRVLADYERPLCHPCRPS